jgi:hypothetical protein
MYRVKISGAAITSQLMLFLAPSAEAYQVKHHHSPHHRHVYRSHPPKQQVYECSFSNEGRQRCDRRVTEIAGSLDAAGNSLISSADEGTVIGSRPNECPHSYCGCGLRLYLGLGDVRLNLASNWARLFPHESAPRPGLAAVRSGHVMYIEGSAGNGQWMVRDYNSGGGLSRMHVRDVRGYAFVNPHAQVAGR